MLNLFTTPRGKDFIFIIPDNATADANGFYVINEAFKQANEHRAEDWDYLAHDLEHRGLSASNSFYDRVDYMDKKLISHGDYYLQFAKLPEFRAALLQHFGADTLKNSQDPYMNDIKMDLWDRFQSKNYIDKRYKYAEAASYVGRNDLWRRKAVLWSMATNVCFAKQVAYGIRAELNA